MVALAAALALSSVQLRARDPIDGSVREYRGVPLRSLVPPGEGDGVLVRCEDGFVALLPLATVERYGPVVASAARDPGGAWHPIAAPRGPRFLAWPNVAHPGLDRDPAITSEGWAWAVASVERVPLGAYLAPLTPGRATAAVARGRSLWLGSCFHCHAIHGAGGMAGWDLSEPLPLWRYLDERGLAAYLRDPRAVNPDGHMPAQRLTAAERRDLFAFLHAAVR